MENPGQDRLAARIAGVVIKVQTKFADAMNKSFSDLQPERIKLLLVLFCLFWGGLSIYFAAHAILVSRQPAINVEQIKVLRHIHLPDDEEIENRVDNETYQRIQDYKKYMDSTHQPVSYGLTDSINVLEQIYLQQKNATNEK